MTFRKKLWAGILILALLSPLGIMIPKWFGAGGAWGEWGVREIEKLAGFAPEGMKRQEHLWRAPLPAYAVPAQNKGPVVESLGYILSAVIGVILIAAVMYLLTKLLTKKNGVE
jgi:cobalt/nickel transport protein